MSGASPDLVSCRHELDQPVVAPVDDGKDGGRGGLVREEHVPGAAEDASGLVGLIADESRLRTFAAVVLGARATGDVSQAAGLPVRETLRALTRLESGGLVERARDGWEPRLDRLRRAASARSVGNPVDYGDVAAESASVLRVFLPYGRLARMPAQRTKRRIVLDHIARVFEPGVRYAERDVNTLLRAFDDDYATLRRYLVDEGFLARAGGEYWRVGGTVPV
jgi:hypothetical protein